jgi:RPAP1-like, C-terminal
MMKSRIAGDRSDEEALQEEAALLEEQRKFFASAQAPAAKVMRCSDGTTGVGQAAAKAAAPPDAKAESEAREKMERAAREKDARKAHSSIAKLLHRPPTAPDFALGPELIADLVVEEDALFDEQSAAQFAVFPSAGTSAPHPQYAGASFSSSMQSTHREAMADPVSSGPSASGHPQPRFPSRSTLRFHTIEQEKLAWMGPDLDHASPTSRVASSAAAIPSSSSSAHAAPRSATTDTTPTSNTLSSTPTSDAASTTASAAAPGGGHTATRFDFDGGVVPKGATLSTASGLHHHGDEQERAGYTLAELLHLCQSTVPAQRAMSLSTLAALLARALVPGAPEAPVLEEMRDSQLVTVLRVSLDSSNLTIAQAALTCVEALLVNKREQRHLAVLASLRGGWRVLAAQPEREPHADTERAEDDQVGSPAHDAEAARNDLVGSLVQRMGLAARLQHLLRAVVPTALFLALPLFRVLARCARHSRRTAELLAAQEGLVDALLTVLPRLHAMVDPAALLAAYQFCTLLCAASHTASAALFDAGGQPLSPLLVSIRASIECHAYTAGAHSRSSAPVVCVQDALCVCAVWLFHCAIVCVCVCVFVCVCVVVVVVLLVHFLVLHHVPSRRLSELCVCVCVVVVVVGFFVFPSTLALL